jgi:hypothetical protein
LKISVLSDGARNETFDGGQLFSTLSKNIFDFEKSLAELRAEQRSKDDDLTSIKNDILYLKEDAKERNASVGAVSTLGRTVDALTKDVAELKASPTFRPSIVATPPSDDNLRHIQERLSKLESFDRNATFAPDCCSKYDSVMTRCRGYKTFYGRKLRLFMIS